MIQQTLVSTIRADLFHKLKQSIAEINTEVTKVTYENMRK